VQSQKVKSPLIKLLIIERKEKKKKRKRRKREKVPFSKLYPPGTVATANVMAD
jgi:hypothetical protein